MATIQESLNLAGKVAVVTGGAKGIGLGIVTRLAEAGAKVVIANRGTDGNEVATQLQAKGWSVVAVTTDVSIEESVRNLINQTIGQFGTIDILVNNAGIYPTIPVMKMTLADWQQVQTINLQGVFLTTKYAAEAMIKAGRGGKIINITSVDALHPSSVGLAHYDASKHGVWGFTKNVALELAPHKIWVNAIAPGGILTPGVQGNMQGEAGKKILDAFAAKIPMQRLGDPDEIGKVALFLASDLSSYMTGSQIVVDGGVLLS